MRDRRRSLILGGSGLLGRHLRARIGPSQSIVTFRRHSIEGGEHFDAETMRLKDSLLRGKHGIANAFILFGVTNLDACARDPGGSAQINVDSIVTAIDDLVDAGIKPVFASSDAVFDGTRGLWSEEDLPNPVLTYGRQKLEVERYLSDKSGPSLIARLSKVVSGYLEDRNPLSEWIEQAERNEPIRCATDLVYSPVDVADAVDALIRLADGPFSGVFHVCGPQAMNRMQLFQVLVGAIRQHRAFHPDVISCRMRDLPLVEPRPLDVSMKPSKLYAALGRRFRPMANVCEEFAKRRFGQQNRSIAANRIA